MNDLHFFGEVRPQFSIDEHGGQLNAAARAYQIPVERWTDISTGINPNGYPVPPIPENVWRRLPEVDDGLIQIARVWAGVDVSVGCLPVPGTQSVLQVLPQLRAHSRVGVPAIGYAEHARAWRLAGHEVVELFPEDIDAALPTLDVLVVINPNNPTGQLFPRETLLRWYEQLSLRQGWLVVDEAFIEASDAQSLASLCNRDGLIVLRSLGKFFGLAGLRAGLVFSAGSLINVLTEKLGPWALSHPARFVMSRALADNAWQQKNRIALNAYRLRLGNAVSGAGLPALGHCDLFVYCPHVEAEKVADALAQQAILVRCFTRLPKRPLALRFGLPRSEDQWRHLETVLPQIVKSLR